MYKVVMIGLILAITCDLVNSKSTYYYGDQGDIVFPGPASYQRSVENTRPNTPTTEQSFLAKSIELAKKMQQFKTIEDFLTIVKGVPESEKPSFIADRMGIERTSAITAIPAACTPAYQVVSLTPKVEDPSVIYFPSCTRVKRCGGCCHHRLLSCQPIEKRILNYQIAVTRYINNSLDYEGKELIPVEEHTSCSCRCSVTPDQCNRKQEFQEDECKCKCLNTDDEKKCKAQINIKIWDADKCECGCRQIESCSEGLYFDKNTCRCQFKPRSRDSYYTWEGNERKVSPPLFIDLMSRRKHKDEPLYK